MIVDSSFLFSSQPDLLMDVCQFNQQLDNTILSLNEGPFWEELMDSYNQLRKEEILMYKCYDC